MPPKEKDKEDKEDKEDKKYKKNKKNKKDKCTDRWIFQVLSPVDKTVLWEYKTPFSQSVPDKWYLDTGNRYLSRGKVNRLCSGEVNNQFLNVIKIEKKL